MGAWTEDEDRVLAEMAKAGASLPDMIARIGRSRDSINGRLHRTGLAAGRTRETRSRAQYRAARLKAKATIAQRSPEMPANPIPVPEAKPTAMTSPEADLVIPVRERRTILTLEAGDCRWPIGDPQDAEFHFCGKSKVAGLPYCEFHARRAFQPPRLPDGTPVRRGIWAVEADSAGGAGVGGGQDDRQPVAKIREDA